jgi:hypothetical protein
MHLWNVGIHPQKYMCQTTEDHSLNIYCENPKSCNTRICFT